MLSLIIAALAAFGWSADHRWQLLKVGGPVNRFDRIGDRVGRVLRYGIKQEKMHKYRGAGLAHHMVFTGFVILLLRTVMLWGRGFEPDFGLFVMHPGKPLGDAYNLLKDVFAIVVVLGASYFLYQRIVVKPARMTLSGEGILILGIIVTMMLSDILYDGAATVLHQKAWTYQVSSDVRDGLDRVVAHRRFQPRTGHVHFDWTEPAGSGTAMLLAGLPPMALIVLAHAGFWVHAALVLIFLNLLPHSKHFHIITALPNIFLTSLEPRGALRPLAVAGKNEDGSEKPASEVLMERIGDAADPDKYADSIAAPGVGVGKIEHFTWKSVLDFYTCTECGRCSDNCPAHLTGKLLSPKHLTLDLRNYLYENERNFIQRPEGPHGDRAVEGRGAAQAEDGAATTDEAASGETEKTEGKADGHAPFKPKDVVVPGDPAMGIIHPDVIWSCTSCRACEEQCPVLISYVDKITDMRRNVVMVRGEFPHELQRPFQGMETNGNPWNLSRLDRAAWSEGLDVPTLAEKGDAKVLYWVGCSASYDDRAKKIARATAKLLKAAGVDFAILGQEESCTGDPARRAGNEFLFTMLAEANVATLQGYKCEEKTVVTACPHCFNTLLNEYPQFGITLKVVHHTEYLLGLLNEKKLTVKKKLAEKLVFHDSCYLGRYNDVYDAPREILTAIGASLVEAEWSRSKGLCCGAGGAQMFMEEKGSERVNKKRTLQLLDTGAKSIASACPFCMTMLTDGLKAENLEESVKQLDVAELLAQACALESPTSSESEGESEGESKGESKGEGASEQSEPSAATA
ncbi:MAG: (Fe-S)-binding protein [Deltaproteobacteria bacterium]|nr:(Fe-S)-binding protein [Deltaproteobacteria bacterium]